MTDFFFFQAEDGIRGWSVTGVQTCALPIWVHSPQPMSQPMPRVQHLQVNIKNLVDDVQCYQTVRALRWPEGVMRSEERRVGKECRSRWWRDDRTETYMKKERLY